MYRLSSNLTLILALFIPVFWITFFGLITGGLMFSDYGNITISYGISAKWFMLCLFLLFFLIIWRTIFRLKRVEIDESNIYVSNYLKTAKYSFSDILKTSSIDFGIFKIRKIILKGKGTFGRKIAFLPSRRLFKIYQEERKADSLFT